MKTSDLHVSGPLKPSLNYFSPEVKEDHFFLRTGIFHYTFYRHFSDRKPAGKIAKPILNIIGYSSTTVKKQVQW